MPEPALGCSGRGWSQASCPAQGTWGPLAGGLRSSCKPWSSPPVPGQEIAFRGHFWQDFSCPAIRGSSAEDVREICHILAISAHGEGRPHPRGWGIASRSLAGTAGQPVLKASMAAGLLFSKGEVKEIFSRLSQSKDLCCRCSPVSPSREAFLTHLHHLVCYTAVLSPSAPDWGISILKGSVCLTIFNHYSLLTILTIIASKSLTIRDSWVSPALKAMEKGPPNILGFPVL